MTRGEPRPLPGTLARWIHRTRVRYQKPSVPARVGKGPPSFGSARTEEDRPTADPDANETRNSTKQAMPHPSPLTPHPHHTSTPPPPTGPTVAGPPCAACQSRRPSNGSLP